MAKTTRPSDLKQNKLTPEGWVYLVILSFIAIGAMLRSVNLLIVMTGMMVAPLVINWRTGVLRLKTLKVKRLPPQRIHAGQLVSIPWNCENSGRQMTAWNVLVHDEISCRANAFGEVVESKPSFLKSVFKGFGTWLKRWILRRKFSDNEVGRVRFLRVKPATTELASYRCFFPRRGEYEVGPAEVSTSYPFGLVSCQIVEAEKNSIFVAPAIGKLHPTWERRVDSIAVGEKSRNRRRGVEEDEFHALRQWRSGDNQKNVHWRSTAKRGYPMVKQFDQQNDRDFAILLDLHAEDEGTFENCETILSFAATAMLQIGNDIQGQIAVAICGRTSEQFYGRNRQQVFHGVMRGLATAEAGVNPQIMDSIAELSRHVSSGTPIFCFSPREMPSMFGISSKSVADEKSGRSSLADLVRWIRVPSDEFGTLFSTKEEDLKPASELASKWTKAAEN